MEGARVVGGRREADTGAREIPISKAIGDRPGLSMRVRPSTDAGASARDTSSIVASKTAPAGSASGDD